MIRLICLGLLVIISIIYVISVNVSFQVINPDSNIEGYMINETINLTSSGSIAEAKIIINDLTIQELSQIMLNLLRFNIVVFLMILFLILSIVYFFTGIRI